MQSAVNIAPPHCQLLGDLRRPQTHPLDPASTLHLRLLQLAEQHLVYHKAWQPLLQTGQALQACQTMLLGRLLCLLMEMTIHGLQQLLK